MYHTLFSNIRLFFGLAVLFLVNNIHAQQNQKIVFPQPQGYYYSVPNQISNTPDGGWLLTCFTVSNNDLNNLPRLIKLNSDGLTEWDHTYTEFSPPLPHGTRISPVSTLNAPGGGWLVSVSDDTTDINLMRVGPSGNLVWSKSGSLYGLHLLGLSSNNTYYGYQDGGATQSPFYELDADGNVIQTVMLPAFHNICLTSNGDIQLFYPKLINGNYKYFFGRYDVAGNQLWESQQLSFNTGKIASAANGGFIFIDYDQHIRRYDAQGVLLNEFSPGANFEVKTIYSIEETADGSILLAGQTVTQRGVMAKLATDYSTTWVAEAPLDAQPPLLWLSGLSTPDGWAVATGPTNTSQTGFVRFFENTGVTIKTISGKVVRDVNNSCTSDPGESGLNGTSVSASGPDYFYTAFSGADGSYQIQVPPGDYVVDANPAEQFFFLCPSAVNTPVSVSPTGSNAVVDLPIQSQDVIHHITGSVRLDENGDCIAGSGDAPLQSWKVEATGGGFNLTDYTDANGNYSMYVPNGDYQVWVSPINPNFGFCGNSGYSVGFNAALAETATVDFLMKKAFECGMMQASVSTAPMRPCTTAQVTVYYKNVGTSASEDVKITVTLDPLLTYVSSYPAPVSINGNVLVFEQGTVAPSYYGQALTIDVLPDCNLIAGQQLCITAAIEPDIICYQAAGWQGAIVNITGECGPGPNEATFTIKNVGTAPNAAPLEYVIIEEQVVLKTGTFQLPAGGAKVETVPITSSTQVGMAQQEPGFPGDTSVNYTLVNCIGMGGNPAGFNGPSGPFISESCFLIANSFDPNDKQAQPLGFGPEHIVWPGTPLSYRVRFQNTGNDTAFLVVVRDTLSTDLDPGTIKLLSSSHPYRFELLAGKIMQFTFDNILLPDSLTNPDGSQGYLEFGIKHRTDLPLGTNIGNSAAIYFDYNKPVITNTVWRKIDQYFTVTAVYTPGETVPAKIFPNPATYMAVIELPEMYTQSDLLFELTDVTGRTIQSTVFTGPRYQVFCSELPAGAYFWRISEKGALLTSGKIVKRDEQ